MSGSPGWLYVVTYLAGALLTALVYAAGFLITIRRWHDSAAARLAATGFGLLLLNAVFSQSLAMLFWLLPMSASGGDRFQMIALNSFSALVVAGGHVLLVLAVHRFLTERAATNDEPPTGLR